MLKSPISAHVPRTPHAAYAWSASATAPVHLDIHIPLILLGSKKLDAKLDDDFTTRLSLVKRRLQLVHAYLVHALGDAGVTVLLWDAPPNPEKLKGTETEEERHAIGSSREVWKQGEERKRAAAEQSKAWTLRATPQSEEEEPFGVHEGWRAGDGLLTEKEKESLADDADVWALPFTLHRYSLLAKDKKEWENEVKIVMDAFKVASETEHPELGKLMVILTSERCRPHITFRQTASVGGTVVPWDEQVVKKLLLLTTAFERELGAFATPGFLLTYKPMSNFLTKRQVSKLRRERRQMWSHFWQEMVDDRRKVEEGRIRRKRRWERMLMNWFGYIEEEDRLVQRQEELLGEEGQEWWQKLHKMLAQGEAADLVRDIAKRTKDGAGSRVALGINTWPLHDQDRSTRSVTNIGETTINTEVGERKPDGFASETRRSSISSSPPLQQEFPPVISLSFPIPVHGTASPLLLSYIEVLSRTVQLALEDSEESIIPFLDSLKRNEKRAQDTTLEGLVELAEQLGCEREKVEILKAHVQQYMHEDEIWDIRIPEVQAGHSSWAFETHAKKTHDQGRRAILSVSRHVRGDTVSNKDNDTVSYPLTYLDRYEFVHGYLAISKTKTLKLLEAEDNPGKETIMNEEATELSKSEDANVEAL